MFDQFSLHCFQGVQIIISGVLITLCFLYGKVQSMKINFYCIEYFLIHLRTTKIIFIKN